MNSRIYTAIAMCCLCAVLLWTNTSAITVSLSAIIISLAGLKFHFKFTPKPFYLALGYLILATIFVFKFKREMLVGGNINIILTNICQYLLLTMAAMIILRRSNYIASWFALYGFVIMILLDKISPFSNSVEKACMLSMVVLAVVFWFIPETQANHIGDKKVKNLLTLTILVMSCSIGWVQASTLYGYYQAGFGYFSPGVIAAPGTDQNARKLGFGLSNPDISKKLDRDNADQIVLQVISKYTPKYLTGKVFDNYSWGRWSTEEQYDLLLADEKYVDDKSSQNVFVLDSSSARNKGEVYEIIPLRHFEGAILRAKNTVAVSINAESIVVNEFGDILSNNGKNNHYTLYCSAPNKQEVLPEEIMTRLTQVPSEVRQEIGNVAKTIFLEDASTANKISALMDFWKGCEYSFDHKVPKDKEPVIYMVNNKPAAHCELYASASCILLRLAGVPTKYVTGFRVDNYTDGSWFVKNKDSHAWIEAWDKETEQWVTVDITSILKDGNATTGLEANTKLTVRDRLAIAWVKDGFGGVLKLTGVMISDAYKSITAAPIYIIAVLVIVTIAITLLICKKCSDARKLSEADKAINKIQRKLYKMDKLLSKRSLTRKPCETVTQFAERIELHGPVYAGRNRHIQWYREFSRLRYGRLL